MRNLAMDDDESSPPGEERVVEDGTLEFEKFLKTIGYGDLYRSRLHEEDATPQLEAPAVPAAVRHAPSTAPAPAAPRRSWRILALAGVLVCAALVGIGQAPFDTAFARQAVVPVFSASEFRSLCPGITADMVRDRIGLPDLRMARAGQTGGEDWWYVDWAPETDRPPRAFVAVLEGDLVFETYELDLPTIAAASARTAQDRLELPVLVAEQNEPFLAWPIMAAQKSQNGYPMRRFASSSTTAQDSASAPMEFQLRATEKDMTWLLKRLKRQG